MTKDEMRAEDFLGHIFEAAQRIQRYIAGMTLEEFRASILVQDAVLRNIEILGEASKNLLERIPDAPQRFPDIPFEVMYGTRNRIVHGYFGVDVDIVWKVASVEIARLLDEVPKAIESFMRT